jgi:alginate O-acetyltransferase complex protein AlgI
VGLFGKDAIMFNIILPLGISFYTFTALSYIIDIYRGKYAAEKNILNVALFISFFPKVTAGPIIRGDEFLPQLKNYQGIKSKNFQDGIQIFAFGLFKKIVLADHLGVFVDDVFFAPSAYNTGTVLLAVVSYSLQIYFDFSGYSDMAIGISKILGFDFKPNFNLPYISENPSQFWKRWHISLSSWLQDYLYIPLGGSRKGEVRTYANLMIVMLVSGLWHGAGWTFVAWGFLHGFISCVHKGWRNIRKGKNHMGALARACRILLMFIDASLLWVVFKAADFANAKAMYKSLFTIHTGISQPYTWSFFAIGVLIIATIIAGVKQRGQKFVNGFYPILDLGKFWSLVVFFTFVGLTIMMGYFGNTAFIYGKF